eukprot:352483-Chlamydomonas_euryale.AAC.2
MPHTSTIGRAEATLSTCNPQMHADANQRLEPTGSIQHDLPKAAFNLPCIVKHACPVRIMHEWPRTRRLVDALTSLRHKQKQAAQTAKQPLPFLSISQAR